MTGEHCLWHADHETRIKRLETEVEEAFTEMDCIKEKQKSRQRGNTRVKRATYTILIIKNTHITMKWKYA